MIIYCIQNLINGKKYIGQSIYYNSEEEFQKSNYWGSSCNKELWNSIKKYGLQCFKRWILIKNIFDFNELDKYERLWIKKLKTKIPNGYNLADGGGGSKGAKWNWNEISKKAIKGRFVLPEIRKKISIKLTGRHRDEASNKKTSSSLKNRYKNSEHHLKGKPSHNKGIPCSEEHKLKQKITWKEKVKQGYISPLKGMKQDENRKKINSESHKGIYPSEETKQKLKISNSGQRNGMFRKNHKEESKLLIKEKRKQQIWKKICKKCNTEFQSNTGNKNFCYKCQKNIQDYKKSNEYKIIKIQNYKNRKCANICKKCHIEFISNSSTRYFCNECNKSIVKHNQMKNRIYKLNCCQCKNEFESKSSRTYYCNNCKKEKLRVGGKVLQLAHNQLKVSSILTPAINFTEGE